MPVRCIKNADGEMEVIIEPYPDSSRKHGGEGLHGWAPEIEQKPAAKPNEPFDPHFGDGKLASGWR